jgi:hypothetical protein
MKCVIWLGIALSRSARVSFPGFEAAIYIPQLQIPLMLFCTAIHHNSENLISCLDSIGCFLASPVGVSNARLTSVPKLIKLGHFRTLCVLAAKLVRHRPLLITILVVKASYYHKEEGTRHSHVYSDEESQKTNDDLFNKVTGEVHRCLKNVSNPPGELR